MLTELIKLTGIFVSGYENGKIQLFNNHVEPLKKQIDNIHQNYINTFLEVRASLEKKEIPMSTVLDFLEQRRHDLAAQRDLTKKIASELKNADRRIVAPRAWKAFEDFNGAVVSYFAAANTIAMASWFSDFIRFMKVHQDMGSKDFFKTNVFGNDPRKDTIEHVTLLLERRLPAALSEINTHYATLRSNLL